MYVLIKRIIQEGLKIIFYKKRTLLNSLNCYNSKKT